MENLDSYSNLVVRVDGNLCRLSIFGVKANTEMRAQSLGKLTSLLKQGLRCHFLGENTQANKIFWHCFIGSNHDQDLADVLVSNGWAEVDYGTFVTAQDSVSKELSQTLLLNYWKSRRSFLENEYEVSRRDSSLNKTVVGIFVPDDLEMKAPEEF